VLRSLRRIGPLGVALTVGQVAWAVRQHWETVPADRRARLQQLLRKTRGNPSNLSPAERRELGEILQGLNLPRLLRRSAMDATLPRLLRRRV
jgi:hypothetical protein